MVRPPLKTVRVKSAFFPNGVLINAEDFNAENDVLFSEPNQATPSKGSAKQATPSKQAAE